MQSFLHVLLRLYNESIFTPNRHPIVVTQTHVRMSEMAFVAAILLWNLPAINDTFVRKINGTFVREIERKMASSDRPRPAIHMPSLQSPP